MNERNRTTHVENDDLLARRCFVSPDTTGITAASLRILRRTTRVSLHTFTLRVESRHDA